MNREGYSDRTAETAIAHVAKLERKNNRQKGKGGAKKNNEHTKTEKSAPFGQHQT